MSFAYIFKGILIGDTGVGKSNLLLRYTDDRFRSEHDITIGVEFGTKMVNVDDVAIKLQLWDTAGAESFRSITRSYYRSAAAAIFVFDVSKRDTFDSLNHWISEVTQHASRSVVKVLVGNKADKEGERQVLFEEAQNFANSHNVMYLETSAKTGMNVGNVFNLAAAEILTRIRNGIIDPADESCGVKKPQPK